MFHLIPPTGKSASRWMSTTEIRNYDREHCSIWSHWQVNRPTSGSQLRQSTSKTTKHMFICFVDDTNEHVPKPSLNRTTLTHERCSRESVRCATPIRGVHYRYYTATATATVTIRPMLLHSINSTIRYTSYFNRITA